MRLIKRLSVGSVPVVMDVDNYENHGKQWKIFLDLFQKR